MAIVKIDKKGRIVIPKSVRDRAKLKDGGYVKIKAKEKSVIIEPLESIADKYFGIYKVTKWPEDLDEFIIEVIKRWQQ